MKISIVLVAFAVSIAGLARAQMQADPITFNPPASVASDGIVHLIATSTSGRPVNLSLPPATPNACGLTSHFLLGFITGSPCSVVASLPADANYAAESVTRTIQVVANTGTRALAVYTAGGGLGTVTSSPAGITCGTDCAGDFATSSTVTLTPVALTGSTFIGWSGICSGTAPCTVVMDATKSVTARFAASTPRLVNLATRGWVFTNDDAMIGGFVIGGTGNKTVVVRARGPSLTASGVAQALPDPSLRLVRSSDQAVIATNEIWSSTTTLVNDGGKLVRNGVAIDNLGFGINNGLDAAILITLAPGAYTAIVTPREGSPGVGMIEIFEIDAGEQPLVNIATRGRVGPGNDVMIAGFIIQGDGPQTVVVRGRGPSMESLGVPDTLANPMLQLVRSSDQATVAVNDNWQDNPNASAISASGYAPSNAQEAAIMITLQPGAYTAILSGVGGTAGTGLVEVFRVGN